MSTGPHRDNRPGGKGSASGAAGTSSSAAGTSSGGATTSPGDQASAVETQHSSYQELRLKEFLSVLSAADATPSAGSAVALVAAMAAGLCAMTARLSPRLSPRAGFIVSEAEQLRDAALALAQADADAYGRLLVERRSPVEPDALARAARVADALVVATAVPAELSRTSARIARLAADLARDANPNVRGEAIAAAVLAAATADAAGALVVLNTASEHHAVPRLDGDRDDAVRALRSARSDADRARALLPRAQDPNGDHA